jgi:hypothetical protein
VSAKLKSRVALLALTCAMPLLTSLSAFAITVEVAKTCSALAQKAYPLRVPGNPAAGFANGTSADYRKYFSQCVANGGKMNEQAPKQDDQQGGPAPSQATGAGNQAPDQGSGAASQVPK